MAKWALHIQLGSVFHNEELTFVERREEIIRRIRQAVRTANKGAIVTGHEIDLDFILDDLQECETASEFDEIWDEFYNWADANRVWVETRSRS